MNLDGGYGNTYSIQCVPEPLSGSFGWSEHEEKELLKTNKSSTRTQAAEEGKRKRGQVQ